ESAEAYLIGFFEDTKKALIKTKKELSQCNHKLVKMKMSLKSCHNDQLEVKMNLGSGLEKPLNYSLVACDTLAN
ncbi:hypothetical protein L0F63_007239, partial [Massospora cicadina]